jgi:hypothetical protein
VVADFILRAERAVEEVSFSKLNDGRLSLREKSFELLFAALAVVAARD